MKTSKRIVLAIGLFIHAHILFAQSFVWTQKSNFPGTARYEAAAFSLGNSGYFCSGANFALTTVYNDLWAYSRVTGNWTQKASLPGTARYGAAGFATSTKGYISTGKTLTGAKLKDLWQYDPATNSWTQKTSFGGTARFGSIAAGIGSNGYVGLGDSSIYNDLWKYNQTGNSWTQKANYPGNGRQSAASFVINSNIYVGTGYNGTYKTDFWEYNSVTNVWTQKANFSGSARSGAVGFAINGFGYLGTGRNASSAFADFKKYNPTSNSWSGITALPGSARFAGEAFIIGNYAYIGLGRNLNTAAYKDLWEYGPFGLGLAFTSSNLKCYRDNSGAISVNPLGGFAPYQYDWSNGNTISAITNLAAGTYTVTVTDVNGLTESQSIIITQPNALAVSIIAPANACKGSSVTLKASATSGTPPYTYNWNNGAFIGSNYSVVASSTANFYVIATDSNGCSNISSVVIVKVYPVPTGSVTASNNGIGCLPDSVLLVANYGNSMTYQWRKSNVSINGATDSIYFAKQTGNYKVTVTNIDGCTSTSFNSAVTVKSVVATVNPGGTVTMCQGATKLLSANVTAGSLYQWRKNGGNINGATNSTYSATVAGTYKVLVTDQVTGCTALSAGTVVVINCRDFPWTPNELQIYPNPSSDRFEMDLSASGLKGLSVKIYDISGRLVANYNPVNDSVFSFGEELVPGTYFVKVLHSEGQYILRVVKSKP